MELLGAVLWVVANLLIRQTICIHLSVEEEHDIFKSRKNFLSEQQARTLNPETGEYEYTHGLELDGIVDIQVQGGNGVTIGCHGSVEHPVTYYSDGADGVYKLVLDLDTPIEMKQRNGKTIQIAIHDVLPQCRARLFTESLEPKESILENVQVVPPLKTLKTWASAGGEQHAEIRSSADQTKFTERNKIIIPSVEILTGPPTAYSRSISTDSTTPTKEFKTTVTNLKETTKFPDPTKLTGVDILIGATKSPGNILSQKTHQTEGLISTEGTNNRNFIGLTKVGEGPKVTEPTKMVKNEIQATDSVGEAVLNTTLHLYHGSKDKTNFADLTKVVSKEIRPEPAKSSGSITFPHNTHFVDELKIENETKATDTTKITEKKNLTTLADTTQVPQLNVSTHETHPGGGFVETDSNTVQYFRNLTKMTQNKKVNNPTKLVDTVKIPEWNIVAHKTSPDGRFEAAKAHDITSLTKISERKEVPSPTKIPGIANYPDWKNLSHKTHPANGLETANRGGSQNFADSTKPTSLHTTIVPINTPHSKVGYEILDRTKVENLTKISNLSTQKPSDVNTPTTFKGTWNCAEETKERHETSLPGSNISTGTTILSDAKVSTDRKSHTAYVGSGSMASSYTSAPAHSIDYGTAEVPQNNGHVSTVAQGPTSSANEVYTSVPVSESGTLAGFKTSPSNPKFSNPLLFSYNHAKQNTPDSLGCRQKNVNEHKDSFHITFDQCTCTCPSAGRTSTVVP